MLPTSASQADATAHGTVPPLEQITANVWACPLALPSHQRRLGYTLSYLLLDDDGRVHVIDPGFDSEENRARLRAAIAHIGPHGVVASILITHLHEDHLGLADALREETGARVVMHRTEADALERRRATAGPDLAVWAVPHDRRSEIKSLRASLRPDEPVVHSDVLLDGTVDRFDAGDVEIEALHTPGHTSGHVCFRLAADKLLFSGDHVLPALHPGIGLGGRDAGDDPVGDYQRSLDLLSPFGDHQVLPGHNFRFTGLLQRVDQHRRHHQRRTDEVMAVMQTDPDATTWDVASSLTWTAGWKNMRGFYLYSALAQTQMHIDHVRATQIPRPTSGAAA